MDMYGISNAVMEENTLHGRMANERAAAQANFKIAQTAFNKTIADTKGRDTSRNETEEATNVSDIQNVIMTGKGIAQGAKGAFRGGQAAVQSSQAAAAAAEPAAGAALASARDLNPTGLTQAGEAAEAVGGDSGMLSSAASAVKSGASAAGSALLGGAQTTGTALAGGARGAVSGLNEAGGGLSLPEALGGTGLKGLNAETQLQAAGTLRSVAGGGEGLAGVEGIIQKGLVKAGGGEALGFVGAKAFGAAGGLIDAGGEINSLIKTDGKSGFTRVNSATGQRVKESGLDIAGELTTEAGSALDVASAFTGGLLVPFAAAVSLAGAGLSVVGSIEDEKSDDKSVGLKSDGTTDASAAPKLAAAPISQAYASLGFVGNMSHSSMANIA